MAYFNSTLAILILVLFNGCFTLPVGNTNLHPQNPVGLPSISTTETNEHMGSDVSTPFSTSADNGKREYMDSFSTTMESTTDMSEEQEDDKRHFDVSFLTTMEPLAHMIGQQKNGKRDFDASLSTTVESTTDKSEEEEEEDTNKREIQTESTTNNLLLSASVPSNVVTKLSTPQSSILPLKEQKYTGLLPSDNENQEGHLSGEEQGLESGSKPTKKIGSSKLIQKPTAQSKLQPLDPLSSDNGVEQSSTEIVPQMALYDQTASDGTSLNLSGNMALDENTMIVTDLPTLLSTSANKVKKPELPLNQGTESLHTEKKE